MHEPTTIPDSDADSRVLDEIRRLLAPRFPDLVEPIVATMSVALVVDPDADRATGTRWGGLPALSASTAWPRIDDLPLSLLFTVDCAEAARLLGSLWTFPGHGELSMFHVDPFAFHDDRDTDDLPTTGVVLHVDGDAPLRVPPEDLPHAGVYPLAHARLRRTLMAPPPYSWEAVGADPVSYMDAVELARDAVGAVHTDYLLGRADMDPDGERHLLTLDTPPGVDWGELVAVSLWMNADDLAAGRQGVVQVGQEVA